MISSTSSQVADILKRLEKGNVTQVWLVSELFKRGGYTSKASLKVQVNYLLKGTRFNKTSQLLLGQISEVLSDVEAGRISTAILVDD